MTLVDYMKRIVEELGGHRDLADRAMAKQEVVAALCRAGFLAGLWAVPEFEIDGGQGDRRKLDVVWAMRSPRGSGVLWRPIAAFEVEGHNVALSSIEKNADSLLAAANAGASIRAMVLFQVGPGGQPWYPSRERTSVARSEAHLRQCLGAVPHRVEVLLDERLQERLGEWMQVAASQQAAAAAGAKPPPLSG